VYGRGIFKEIEELRTLTNEIVYTNHFKNLYKRKSRKEPVSLMERIDRALLELQSSYEPERLGEKKKGKLSRYYAYSLGGRHRILYTVERFDDAVIVGLHRICDHKQVYDKD
jgi:mRNA-degrading endonuclease RelE of RelBE toxin-antitoxin system